MELNREQIIKALQCCRHSDSDEKYCADCPYYAVKYCAAKISEDALALINSQEQRIKELTEERKDFEIRALRAENEATKYKDRYETAKQAHEMLSESYDHLEKTKDELIAERSRLTEVLKTS